MSHSATFPLFKAGIRAAGIFFAVAAILLVPAAGLSQVTPNQTNAAAGSASTAETVSQLKAKLADAQKELNVALSAQTNLPAGATAAEVIEYRSLLQRLVRSYQFHLDDLAALEGVRQKAADLERTRQTWTGFAEPPPYSVLMVDDLRDAVQSAEEKIKAATVAIQVTATFITSARATLKESDEKLRRLNEQLETAKTPDIAVKLRWQRELERARNRMAAASVATIETKRQLSRQELSETQQLLALTQRQLLLASQQVTFPQADLDKVLHRLDDAQNQLDQESAAADAELEARRNALDETRENLRLALQDPQAAATNGAAISRLQNTVDLRNIQTETAVQQLAVLRQILGSIGTGRQLWQTRFTLFDSKDPAVLQSATRQLTQASELIQTAKPYYQQQLALAASQLAEEQNRLQNLPIGSEAAVLSRDRLDSYEERSALYTRALQSIDKQQRLISYWQASIDAEREALPWFSRVKDLFSDASGFVAKLWHFELFTAVDTITVDGQEITGRRGITVGKVAMALIILIVGYWLSDLVSRLIEPIAVKRLKIERNQASLIRRWVRVVLVIGLLIFSLVSVKIPLTVFAFAGGALAIGIGFGMQTMLKNFISGIIILFERPFRVGDVLDVDNLRGTVTSIGIRSSVIQRWDSTETLIPNSTLLENVVTNWTYSNRTVRFTVTVGVAYGSDTRRVSQLLEEIAERHGLVQKDPKPQVIFLEFGDNALTFELRYWVDIVRSNGLQIGSDLRHMIATTFGENKINIAFPQRDVHLDSVRPLQVQMVPPPAVKQPGTAPEKPAPGVPAGSQ